LGTVVVVVGSVVVGKTRRVLEVVVVFSVVVVDAAGCVVVVGNCVVDGNCVVVVDGASVVEETTGTKSVEVVV
jgi:hypothetical protein